MNSINTNTINFCMSTIWEIQLIKKYIYIYIYKLHLNFLYIAPINNYHCSFDLIKEVCQIFTLFPKASKLKLSAQETLAWSTSRPSSSKASNINTSNPWQLLWLSTFITKPSSCISTSSYKIINNKHRLINYILQIGIIMQ